MTSHTQVRRHRRFVAYTDGSYIAGVGAGWGVRILYPDGSMRELGGPQRRLAWANSLLMELRATVEALKAMRGEISGKKRARLVIKTDNRDVLKWVKKMRAGNVRHRRGGIHHWRNELRRLDGLDVWWRHVHGHSGHPHNERAHEIAYGFAKGGKEARQSLNLAGDAGRSETLTEASNAGTQGRSNDPR